MVMHDFLTELRRRQGDQSQSEFARLLGTSQANLSRLLSGEQDLSLDMGTRIMRRYPELRALVLAALFEPRDVDVEEIAS